MRTSIVSAIFLSLILVSGCSHSKLAKRIGQKGSGQKIFTLERSWARHTLRSEYLGYRLNHIAEPVLFENLVIQANEIDGVRAYKKKSGRAVWQRSISGGVSSPVRLYKDVLYFGGGDGFYHAVSARTGDALWSFPVRSEGLGAPLVTDDTVYFLSGAGVVYAVRAANGEQVWLYSRTETASLTVRGASEPSLYNGRVLVGFSDGSLVALNRANGTVIWEVSLGEGPRFKDVDSKPVLDGDRAYVSSYDGRLYAVRAATGEVLWSHDEGTFLPVTVDKNRIYYASSTGKIIALDKTSGKLIWSKELKNSVASQPVVHRGLLIFGEWSGGLKAVDLQTGQDVAHFSTGRGVTSMPAVDGPEDMFYIMTTDANLFALRLAFRHPNEVWSWER